MSDQISGALTASLTQVVGQCCWQTLKEKFEECKSLMRKGESDEF